jgi:hypothetical protein
MSVIQAVRSEVFMTSGESYEGEACVGIGIKTVHENASIRKLETMCIVAAVVCVAHMDNGTGEGLEPNIGRGLRGEAKALNGEIMPIMLNSGIYKGESCAK